MTEKPAESVPTIRTVVEAPAPCRRVVKAEVDRAVYETEYAKRLKQAVKSHHQPGFRKGRTPRAVVEREQGDRLRSGVVEQLIQRSWMTAVLEHKLAPLNEPVLENFDFGEDGPLSFELAIEVKPEIPVVDFEGFRVRRRQPEVADGDVDDVVERLRESRAVYDRVERAAEAGDQILLDLVPEAGEGEPEGPAIEDQRFELGAASNMEAFNTELVGVSAGDEREVAVAYPDDHPNEGLRGRTVKFNCRIKEVAAKVLPEADDDFAAALEPGKTLLELRTNIRNDLQKELERQVAGELDQQLASELVSRNDVPLPPSMVEKYLERGLEEMHRRNTQMGGPPDAAQDEEYRQAGRPHAEKALAVMLLLEAIRAQEDIKVEDQDVEDRIEEIALEHGFEVDRYREFMKSGQERDRLEYDLLERRTYDFLLSRAEIEDVPADTDVLAPKE